MAREDVTWVTIDRVSLTAVDESSDYFQRLRNKRILVVDDDEFFLALITELLKHRFAEINVASTGEEGLEIMRADPHDLMLLDISLPDMTGFDLRERLRRDRRFNFLPFIYLSSYRAFTGQIRHLDITADDFMTKPVDHEELINRVYLCLARIERYRSMAVQDPLTGLFNRLTLFDTWDRLRSMCQRKEEPMSVVMLDLDHFKEVNDTYGHLAGDDALCHVADVLRDGLRKTDVIFRIGGEEIMILMPYCNGPEAVNRVDSLRKQLNETPVNSGGVAFSVTFSAAAIEDQWQTEKDDIFSAVDAKMYEAKAGGRNRVLLA